MTDPNPTRALLIPLGPDDPSSGIRLMDMWCALVSSHRQVIGIGILCLMSVLALFFVTDREYRSTVVIIVAEQSGGGASVGALTSQLGGLASIAGLSLPGSSGLRVEAFATLSSRDLIRRFVVDRNLKPLLFHELWNAEAEVWETETNAAPSDEKAITYFQEKVLEINRDPGSNIVNLSITWTDRFMAEQWANGLVDLVNDTLRERAISEAAKSIEFLEAEIVNISNTDIQSAVYALIEEQMAKAMYANVRTDYAFSVIDPATPPDSDNPTSPRLLFFVMGGGCLWVFLSLILIALTTIRNHAE